MTCIELGLITMILASWAVGRVPGHIEDNALDSDQGRTIGVRAYHTIIR